MAKKILLIEDDLFVRDIYTRELRKGNYEIIIAEDGQEGVDKTKAEKYDLILLDIMLPKKTGIDALKEFRMSTNPNKETAVYLLTNLGQGSIIKQAMELGAQGYLLKARVLPSQVLKAVNDFFETGPMKIDLKEFGLE
ncbi:response regulator [Patescibacteria group bacterium]|nr:response regulator [Patescibacteria group bacterium]